MEKILKASQLHQKPKNIDKFQYGTAGFRMNASILDSVMFTTGILAGLRSKYLGGKYIGIMITASHNPPCDNGVKLIDPMGEMLEQHWESYATKLANAATPELLIKQIHELVQELKIDLKVPVNVLVARDSRDSGPILQQAVIDGLNSLDANVKQLGLLTTPQCHFLVKNHNLKDQSKIETAYFEKISNSYKKVYELIKGKEKSPIDITIDAANGIGAPKVEIILNDYLSNEISSFKVVNDKYNKPETLNFDCGADYVKTGQKLPNSIDDPIPNKLYASFDGDADRVVCYYVDDDKKFHLLDGDKISTLLARYFLNLIKELNLNFTVGVVQTAYANGSSTNYLTKVLKIPVECTPTGVKHLHHVAQKFDIGIYFEANGHGTVLFSDNLIEKVGKLENNKLYWFTQLINQTVGDAISDLLTVLIILSDLALSPENWDSAYTDLPNKLAKVVVKDRNEFQTTNAERTLISPKGLQEKIDEEVSKVKNGRSFVRASGTEDAVRVYAEAGNKNDVEKLSVAVCDLVKKFA